VFLCTAGIIIFDFVFSNKRDVTPRKTAKTLDRHGKMVLGDREKFPPHNRAALLKEPQSSQGAP
jgi:preprotein translocase subunit SecY